MTNTNLLKGAIRAKGLTQQETAVIMGISTVSLNYKINNRREFTASEISKLVDLLEINNKDEYFFAQDVAKMDTKGEHNA